MCTHHPLPPLPRGTQTYLIRGTRRRSPLTVTVFPSDILSRNITTVPRLDLSNLNNNPATNIFTSVALGLNETNSPHSEQGETASEENNADMPDDMPSLSAQAQQTVNMLEERSRDFYNRYRHYRYSLNWPVREQEAQAERNRLTHPTTPPEPRGRDRERD